MDPKMFLLVVLLLAVVVDHQVSADIESFTETWNADSPVYLSKSKKSGKRVWDEAFKKFYQDFDTKSLEKETAERDTEFYFNRPFPKADEIQALKMKCVPGRTVIKITDKSVDASDVSSGENDDAVAGDMLRTHMNTGMKEEYCKVCVCSVEGKDEYCSRRPAMNVNECLRMSMIMEQFKSNVPFDHTRTLAYRVRRDLIWHNDEIPYKAKARCRRGHSYYSNSVTANNTDIDVASDVESLIDYSNKDICLYCVCTVDGEGAGCLNRDVWFCEYFRLLRVENAMRDKYTSRFKQDRPTYFRSLPWRMRRTLDDNMYNFMEAVGSEDGGNTPAKCIPYVSEYTDCTEENQCSGCKKCYCVSENRWSCQTVLDCPQGEGYVDDETMDNALYALQEQLDEEDRAKAATTEKTYVPVPERGSDYLLGSGDDGEDGLDERIKAMMRSKRSINDHANKTDGVTFYHTVDELNEDTLKAGNISGTLQAQKVEALVTPKKASRRNGVLSNDNLSKNSLHIEHNQKIYEDHLADNKIDVPGHNDDKYRLLSQTRINTIFSNHTQKQKDKDLSKLVVNELKSGMELIGDKSTPVMSNITFTPQNDTLTAMAFIAGNLLNKLWNMEKASGEDSQEAEAQKREKIANLLDLFKEPLNIRQESFLKSALEKLSGVIDDNKSLKNVSICEKVEETVHVLGNNETSEEDANKKKPHEKCRKTEISGNIKLNETKSNVKTDSATVSKVNNVLSLISKFQNIQNNLNNLKKSHNKNNENIKRTYSKSSESVVDEMSPDESESLNVFGNILEKITKLLLPPRKSKKLSKSIKNQSVFKSTQNIAKTLKNMFNIEIDESTLTAKDKIILDYLNTVQREPKCILDNLRQDNTKTIATIEGDILLNLSEFFKVKSMVDLMKLVEDKANLRSSAVTTTEKSETFTEATSTTTAASTTEGSNKLAKTKDKLKAHLKNIIEDLVELQKAKGQPSNNISIVEALPCIYNILNADKDKPNNKDKVSQVDRVTAIFNSLKNNLQSTPTRRSNIDDKPRPKSAVVWERIVKNLDKKRAKNTRRNMVVVEPKSFDELKKQIDEIESSSKTYKNQAFVTGVPPADRLVLLKTLSKDIEQYIKTLDDIKNSLSNLKDISIDNKNELDEFVENAATNINLNKKIVTNMNNLNFNNKSTHSIVTKKDVRTKENYFQKQPLKMLDSRTGNERNNIKLSRDAIINQLIKNRMQLYIKLKESKGANLNNDLNYDIAKKILEYIENGNNSIARELYKVLISQNKKTDSSTDRLAELSPISKKKPSILTKEPLIQFEAPKSQVQWLSQDTWLKQLVNLKKMRA